MNHPLNPSPLLTAAAVLASRRLLAQGAPNPAVPIGTIAGHTIMRVLSNGSVAEAIGYYPFVDSLGNQLFAGAPGERNAMLSFRTGQFRINTIANLKVLHLRLAPNSVEGLAYRVYFDPEPRRDFSQPTTFSTGKLVATFEGTGASVVSIEGKVVNLNISFDLISSSDFTFNGREVNIGQLVRAVHLRANGPAPSMEELSGGSLISLPLAGAFTASAPRS